MVSVRTLVLIAGVGGSVTAATGYTLHSILQQRVRDSPVYKEALKLVNNNPAVVSLLGKPVKAHRIDVGNKNNILSLTLSTLEVPVKGPKNNAMLYIAADRSSRDDQWNLYKVEVEILDKAGGRLSVVNKDPCSKHEVNSS